MTPRFRVGDLVTGRVLEIQVNGALIGFPEGEVGFLHASEIPDADTRPGEANLVLDQEVVVKVIGSDRLERPALSLRRVSDQDRQAIAYHREAIAFGSALTAQSSSVPIPQQPEDRIEWRLKAWLKGTDTALARIKRRHGQRISRRLELD